MLWLKDHLLNLVEHYGIIALFFAILLETLGLPLPGESALIASAVAAGAGDLNIWSVILAAYVAAVLGDNIGYLIGRRYGRAVILRHGARIGITHDKYRRAEIAAQRFGPLMVIGARFVILLRQLNGLVAGTIGMHWAAFLGANLIGAALWVGFWSAVAYHLGHSVSLLPWIWNHLSVVAMVAVPLLMGLLGVLYWRQRRRTDNITPK